MDWWGGDSRHEATLAAIEAFTESTGIEVTPSYGAWSGWESKKGTEYAAGTNADVQQTNFDWINKYDQNGSTYLDLNEVSDILDLTQWSDSDLSIVKDSNGGIAGVPTSLTGRTFYWNETTYEAAGLSVPTTLAELEAAGPVFQEVLGDDYYPMVCGEYDRMILMTYYLQAQYGTPIISEDSHLTFSQEQLQEGLEFIARLEAEHVIPSIKTIDGEGASSMDQSQRFIEGKYAGILEWDTAVNKYINALAEGQSLVVGAPFEDMGPKGTGSYTKVSQMFSISAKTSNKEQAAQLLNYLLNEEEGVLLMGTERGIPESKAALKVLQDAGAIDELTQAAHDSVMNSNPLTWNPLFDNDTLKGAMYDDVFTNLSSGKWDSAAAAEQLFTAMDAVAPYAE